MQNRRDREQQILRAKLIELSELIAVLAAAGQVESADGIFHEQRRIADRLARLTKGGSSDN